MGKGGGSQPASQNVTTTNNPPAYLMPYLQNLAKDTYSQYQSGANPQYNALQQQISSLDSLISKGSGGGAIAMSPGEVYSNMLTSGGNNGPLKTKNINGQTYYADAASKQWKPLGGGGVSGDSLSSLTQQRADLQNQLSGLSPYDASQYLFDKSYTVDPSQASNDALSQLEALARAPDTLTDTALSQLQNIASGNMLNGNPYIDAVAERAGRTLGNQYKSAVDATGLDAAAVGRYGSGLYQKAIGDKKDALGQALADQNTSLYFNNYNTERQLMQDAIYKAPQLSQARYNQANMLAQVGATRDNLAQQKRNEEIYRFETMRDLPSQELDKAISRLMGLAGGYGTSNQSGTSLAQQKQTGGLGSAITGGLGGMSIGTSLAGGLGAGAGLAAIPGIGWIGAGLGALGGLLS